MGRARQCQRRPIAYPCRSCRRGRPRQAAARFHAHRSRGFGPVPARPFQLVHAHGPARRVRPRALRERIASGPGCARAHGRGAAFLHLQRDRGHRALAPGDSGAAAGHLKRRGALAVTFPTDLNIARRARLLPMPEIAAKMGIGPHLLEPYGYDVAKIRLDAIDELADRPKAKYVVVSAITPTPLGEGKTTTTVGLGQALSYIGKRATVAIRQPSMGPTFGIKGGAAGGGYSQVVPMERLNLHLTGDFHAVTAAHNLLAAMIDNYIHHSLRDFPIDLHSITWRRVLDVSDRVLRNIIVGLGQREDGVIRQTGFDITAASEVMAVLALSTSLQDMRQRLGRMVIGLARDGKPITADFLRAGGAMTVIMRDAIKPNLLQTLENTPVLVHAGPFGNIANGASSVLADLIGIHGGDFLSPEAGTRAAYGAQPL